MANYYKGTIEERFMDKVFPEPNSGCWLWGGALARGYGEFQIGTHKKTRQIGAHRFSYQMHVGPIPEGLDLDHLCGVRSCVNPGHLEPVTRAENLRRGTGAPVGGCVKGHMWVDGALYVSPKGKRSCRLCNQQRSREWYIRCKTRGM